MTTADSRTNSPRRRVLTGDTPTGRLHLGHYVGSIENRLKLQQDYDCFWLIANMHAFTTNAEQPADIRESTIEIVKDWISTGMDPERACFCLQSEIPAISELSWYFAMLIPFNRVMRNPTLKTEIEAKGLGDTYPFGFPLYAVGQCADILIFRPDWVPVGKDQSAHLEMTREVARKFNVIYCGVNPKTEAEDFEKAGGVFPIPGLMVGDTPKLVGTDGEQKMSKSLNNAIFLSDTSKQVKKKIGQMYPGQSRGPNDPGNVEINPVFGYADIFVKDKDAVAEMKERYRKGDDIGDGHVKALVIESINELLEPMREQRAQLEGPKGDAQVIEILREGTKRANLVAEETLAMAKEAMKVRFWDRRVEW